MPKAHFRAVAIVAALISATVAGLVLAQETTTQPPATPPEGAAPAEGAPAETTPAPADPAAPAQTETTQPGVTETKPDPNQVVARVNGADITRQEVIDSAADLPPQLQEQIDMIFPKLLERYIGMQLLEEKGRAEKLAEDPEVKKMMEAYEDEAIRQVYVVRYLDAQVNEDAIRQRYERNLKDNPPPEEVRAAHILVEKEEDAKALIEQIKAGGDFAALAKEKSTDKGSGANGGELGWFTKEVMVKEFADAAYAMKVDEVSAVPVKSQFGYHIIKLEERRTQPAPTLDSQREQIRRDLSEETIQALVTGLRKEGNVEILGPDGKPVADPQPQPQP